MQKDAADADFNPTDVPVEFPDVPEAVALEKKKNATTTKKRKKKKKKGDSAEAAGEAPAATGEL